MLFQRISAVLLIVPKNQNNYDAKIGFVAREVEEDRERIASINSTLNLLRTNSTLQQLIPNLCRFFYQQTKNYKKIGNYLYTLQVIVKALDAIIANPHISLQYHLVQILPTLFSCVVSSQLGEENNDNHWNLRVYAAQVIAFACWRHRLIFPDLVSRVVKTYMEAVTSDKSLSTVYGGVYGLLALLDTPSAHYIVSNEVVSHLILTEMMQIYGRVESTSSQQESIMCITGIVSVVGTIISLYYTRFNRSVNQSQLNLNAEKKRKREEENWENRSHALLSEVVDRFGEKLFPYICKEKQLSSVRFVTYSQYSDNIKYV